MGADRTVGAGRSSVRYRKYSGGRMIPKAIEGMIQRTYERMLAAQTVDGDFGMALHWYWRMAHYIKRRSPQRIREMEIQKRIAR
jgi:hypothetical protein